MKLHLAIGTHEYVLGSKKKTFLYSAPWMLLYKTRKKSISRYFLHFSMPWASSCLSHWNGSPSVRTAHVQFSTKMSGSLCYGLKPKWAFRKRLVDLALYWIPMTAVWSLYSCLKEAAQPRQHAYFSEISPQMLTFKGQEDLLHFVPI